jgi:hypothetical protein
MFCSGWTLCSTIDLPGGWLTASVSQIHFVVRGAAGKDRCHVLHALRAGAALRNATTILRAGEADVVTDHPEQRHARVYVDVVRMSSITSCIMASRILLNKEEMKTHDLPDY